MTINEARKLLDNLKDGKHTHQSNINEALYTTGDLQRRTSAFDLDGWIKRRKTIRLAKSQTA